MADLIDRQAAIKAVDDLPNCYNGFSDTYDKAYIIGVLEELPSAQPEIVRCKDCRHRGKLECPFGITVFDAPKDDEFCSRAERRTDDEG